MSVTGAELIAAERRRQVEVEGYDATHDDGRGDQLIDAAIAYALVAEDPSLHSLALNGYWPWPDAAFKPAESRVRNLEKAGALLAAAIDAAQQEGAQ